MKCEQAGAMLVDYQRDELAAAERTVLALHLQQCEHCSAELTALLQMGQLLDREQQPSPDARQRFLVQLQQQTGNGASPMKVRPAVALWLQQLWLSRPLAAFSYSAALLVVGMLSGQLLPPHSLGVGPQMVEQKLNQERVIQLCPVPSASAAPVL